MIFKYWNILGNFNAKNRKIFDKKYGFKRANREILKSWKAGVKTFRYLNSAGIPVYLVLGNQDFIRGKRAGSMMKKNFISPGSQIPIIRKLKNLIYVHKRAKKLGNYNVVGFNSSYSRTKKPKLNKKLFRKKPLILVTHGPAHGTKFGKIKDKRSPRYGEDVGNLETQKIIKKYKPFLHVCGHMHEYWGWQKIGKTTIVASGFGCKGQAILAKINGKLKLRRVRIR